MAIGKPLLEKSSQGQKRSTTQILTLSDPKIRGQEPKTLSKRAHNPLLKEAGLTKPTAAHPSGGPVQYCSARNLHEIPNLFLFIDLHKGVGERHMAKSLHNRKP